MVANGGRYVLALSSRGDGRLGEALRRHVPSGVPPGPGGLLGLELEFSVRRLGNRIHFGSLIHRLALDGTALDPGDPNAYRCSWGGVITSDGAEAEIAVPPVHTRPGFTGELQTWAETGEAELCRALPPGIELAGYSAHFSAAMPARLNDPVSLLYAETFAADLMLLMDRADSPGLLVRPRPGRTELCGEFVEGEPLSAVAAFVAGSARACAAAVRSRSARAVLPPRLDVRLARAVHRYGWYVDRRAFGTDLHAASREALLPRASGGRISAQSHLELAWLAAREALAEDAAAADVQAADAMVAGSLPLPAERGQPRAPAPGQPRSPARSQPDHSTRFIHDDHRLRTAPVPRLGARVRPGFTLRPAAATWDFAVFEARGPARAAYVCVPRASLPGFVGRLDEGALDAAIAGYLALPARRRVLSAHRQTGRLGVYDRIGAPAGLLAPERDPQSGRRESGQRGAKPTFARPGKRNRQQHAAPKSSSRFIRKAAVIGAVVTALLAGGGVTAAVLSNGHGGPRGNTAAVVSFAPHALSFPDVAVNSSATRSLTVTNTSDSPVTLTRMRITGPGRQDFSVEDRPGRAHAIGQAVQPAVLRPPCQRPLSPTDACKITVTFTPRAPGKHTASLRVYLASHQRPWNIPLTGTGVRLTLSPATLAPAPAGYPYSQQISVVGGTGPYTFAVTGALPPGLSLDSQTGVIGGTPTAAGSYPFTITAGTAASASTASKAYTQQINLALTPATLPDAITGIIGKCGAVFYKETITAVGGTAPYTYQVTKGPLPPKMVFSGSTGILEGTPTMPGKYTFTVTATDSSSPAPLHATQTYTVTEIPCT